MTKFEAIKSHVSTLDDDAKKFYENGNKAAGTRLRNGLQKLKTLAQEARIDVTQAKKA